MTLVSIRVLLFVFFLRRIVLWLMRAGVDEVTLGFGKGMVFSTSILRFLFSFSSVLSIVRYLNLFQAIKLPTLFVQTFPRRVL